jgi:3-hydroxyacyl-[acyl-carrier-protein] dehydratase
MLSPPLKVHDLLPHRHPFLFIDEIIAAESGLRAQALYHVPANHPYLNRHGDLVVFPSVLLAEALAQIAAVCIALEQPANRSKSHPKGYLVRIDKCSLNGFVQAEETLVLTASLRARYGSLFGFDSVGEASGKTVAKASLTLYLEP